MNPKIQFLIIYFKKVKKSHRELFEVFDKKTVNAI